MMGVFTIGTYYVDSAIKKNKKTAKNNKMKQAS